MSLLEIDFTIPNADTIKDFEDNDPHGVDGTLPAWIFCVPEIKMVYNVNATVLDPNARQDILDNAHDHGELFAKFHDQLISQTSLVKYQVEIDNLKAKLLELFLAKCGQVPQCIADQGNVLDALANVVLEYKNTKTRSKVLRDQWKELRAWMQDLAHAGIRIGDYIHLSHNVQVPKMTIGKLDTEFENVLQDYSRTLTLVKTERNAISNLRYAALECLGHFLQNQNVKRIGRFFKRWTELSTDQKVERIDEYLEHVSMLHNFDQAWVLQRKAEITNVGPDNIILKWNQKQGLVANVNGLCLSPQGESKFKIRQTRKTTRSAGSGGRKESKKSSENVSDEQDLARLHRILVKVLVRKSVVSSKESVVNEVVCQFSSFAHVRSKVRPYVDSILDDFCCTIQNLTKDDL